MQEVLLAEGFGFVGRVGGVDVEDVGDAGGGDFDGFGVLGLDGAVFEGGGEEVYNGEGELFLGVEGACLIVKMISMWYSKFQNGSTNHDGW